MSYNEPSSEPIHPDTNTKLTLENCVLHVNIRSISKNFDELCAMLTNYAAMPLAIVLSETWLSDNDDTDMFQIDGYFPIECVNRKTRGGGVAIYISKQLTYTKVNTNYTLETLTLSCRSKKSKQFLITAMYNPLNNNKFDFIKQFDNLLESLTAHNLTHIIIGDFNINISTDNDLTNLYKSTIESNGYKLHSKENTRVTTLTMTCIDHIVSNISNVALSDVHVHRECITDHYPISIKLPGFDGKTAKEEVTYKDMSFLSDPDRKLRYLFLLQNKLAAADLFETNDVNTSAQKLIEITRETVNQFVTVKTIKMHPNERKRGDPLVSSGNASDGELGESIFQNFLI